MKQTKPRIPKKRNDEEHQIQAGIMNAVELIPRCEWLHAIPNGGSRHIAVAKKLKAEGVKSGIPDLFLPVPMGHFHGLYIEVKIPTIPGRKGGVLSPNQKRFRDYADGHGYKFVVVRSVQDGVDAILKYLGVGSICHGTF